MSLSLMSVGLRQIRPNFSTVTLGSLTIYFSYETPIAFEDHEFGEVSIRENVWGPTTGKHLNYINSDKSVRVDSDTFQHFLNDALRRLP